jgi:hypothetical protein
LSSQGIGTAVGGLVFGIGGGIAGDWAGEKAGAAVYYWVADTKFTSLMPMPVPNNMLDLIPQ